MKTQMKRWKRYAALGAAVLVLAPATALAHREAGQAAGFLSGLEHPVSGLDHVVAMIAVGLWGAVLGPPAIWVLPVAFPVVMALGGLMGLLGFPLPGVEIGIAVSAIVLGAMVLAQLRPSALARGSARRVLCDLPRPCAWPGAARRHERAPLQFWLRHRHGPAALGRHPARRSAPLVRRAPDRSCRRRRRCARGAVLPLAGGRMRPAASAQGHRRAVGGRRGPGARTPRRDGLRRLL